MPEIKFNIHWDEKAAEDLYYLLQEIKNRSTSLAETIKISLLEKLKQAALYPHSFEKDQLKAGNRGNYRKVHVIHIRIAYKIDNRKKILNIIRVKHSSAEPLKY